MILNLQVFLDATWDVMVLPTPGRITAPIDRSIKQAKTFPQHLGVPCKTLPHFWENRSMLLPLKLTPALVQDAAVYLPGNETSYLTFQGLCFKLLTLILTAT